MNNNIPEIFASLVFNDKVMKQRLPEKTYTLLQTTIDAGKPLNLDVANEVAKAMKDWAIEKGATHFTHWFQPMTGITAEKHDSFITPSDDGGVIMEFSGKELVQGEPDASSLPSGGLRCTFEARGYTAWDPTSYAFIKDKSLYIPTAFCSYGGNVLDKKTPLLRSMQAINKQAKRILSLFGKDVKNVNVTVGAEQEYFLIDKQIYNKRMDLVVAGRTLFGANPPKGQEMNDYYFGSIKPRVAAFMQELEYELWKVGVFAKTKHNESAPAQHELAPIYCNVNTATDHNQLTMELMKSIALKHNLACLLHEKPFKNINGSGKHNNWSLATDAGVNLLEPGATPYENAQFLLFLLAVIKAADDYQSLLVASISSAGNDLRLGAGEAPPSIISVYLGEELTEILNIIEKGAKYESKKESELKIGVDVLPNFPKDTSDRNRTSPFAFTGNKFEFRMLGSSASVAAANIKLNTIVAESLCYFADKLENSKNFKSDLNEIIRSTIQKHKRIIFNGNNYSSDWVTQAAQRGLLNIRSTPEALEHLVHEKSIALFEKHGVFTRSEVYSRYEVSMENYYKTVHIEALTMLDMARKEIMPSVVSYLNELTKVVKNKSKLSVESKAEVNLIKKITSLFDSLYSVTENLQSVVLKAENMTAKAIDIATFYRDTVIPCMNEVRKFADELEMNVAKKHWAHPSYYDLLFSVR
jgi:glutamine synthetase